MAASSENILFEALCTPPLALGDRGLLLLAGMLGCGSLVTGGVFLALGAWPVLGFTAVEGTAVISLLLLYRRRARRRLELVVLTEGRLTIHRRDNKGRPQEFWLDPYWARLRLEERNGRVSALRLVQRGMAVEIGELLGEAAKRDLAESLGEALRRYREPVFDNPQLR